MAIEIQIKLKDADRTLTRDWLIYDEITLVEDDITIQECLKQIREEFKGEPEDVILKAKMVLR